MKIIEYPCTQPNTSVQKPKILYLLHKSPYPPTDSTKFRIYHSVLKALSSDFESNIVIITWEKVGDNAVKKLTSMGNVIVVELNKALLALNIVKRLLSPRPWQAEMLYDPAIKKIIWEKMKNADIIYVHTQRLGRYIETLEPAVCQKVIFDFNDSHARHYIKGWLYYPLGWRLAVLIEGIKLKFYERKMLRFFPSAAIVAEHDKRFICRGMQNVDRTPLVVYPSVPFQHDIPPRSLSRDTLNLYFVGNLRYYPNREGMEYFIRKIWPLIQQRLSKAMLYVIGKGGEKLAERYKTSKRIVFTGYLSQQELESLMPSMHLFISPVRIGSGIQAKIIEALSASRPVIAVAEATMWVYDFPPLTGLYRCTYRDPIEWAYTTEHIMNEYESIIAQLQNRENHALIKAYFSAESVAARYKSLVDSILQTNTTA